MKRVSAVLLLNPLLMHVMASFADESTGQGTSATNRPNIIIMQPDDLQFFDEWSPPPNNPYTPNRQVSLPTNGLPNIDSLRLNGLQMKQAYTASPMCGTSRYSTITGKYPSRAATVRENANYYDYEEGEPGLVTIPTTKLEDVDGMNDCSKDNIAVQFQNNGYRTAMIGKFSDKVWMQFWELYGTWPISCSFILHLPCYYGFWIISNLGKWHLSRIDDDSYTYESAVEIVKGCGFDTVDGLYVENMVADPDSFNNYSDGTFSHNMEWITYEAVQFIESDDEEVSDFFSSIYHTRISCFPFCVSCALISIFATAFFPLLQSHGTSWFSRRRSCFERLHLPRHCKWKLRFWPCDPRYDRRVWLLRGL